ncbi:MAG: alpha/beta hydrolase [Chloroflexota bacterium]|nr:alpha/beta hydrolase [Dehalococcoidia bacterium]MDW8252737.1 alpha/beta hydrolase [Chloroflexota bacterium]
MKRGFIDTVDGQLHYWTEGEGPPLVLLHMTPDPRSFERLIPLLSPEFRVVALDLPGYGDSDRPPTPYTTAEQFAAAILRAVDALRFARFSLLGHMTGANLAAEVAAMAPERIERLVLSELFDWGSRPELRGVHATRFPAPDPQPDGSHLLALWNQYSGMLGEVRLDDVQRRFYVLFQAVYKGPKAGGEIYGPGGWATAAPYTIERQPLVDRLPKITAPTLILCAGQGVLRSGADPRVDRERLTALLPNGRSLVVPEISHVAPFTAPRAFADAILPFLRGDESAGG